MRTLTIIALLGAQALTGCSSDEPRTPAPQDGPLEPPASGLGIQYRMTSTIGAGQEVERCKLFVAPPEGLLVQREEVRFSPGSHHVVLYKTSYTEIPATTRRGVAVNGAEVHDCSDGAPADWDVTGIVGGSQSFEGDSFLGALPAGVALRVEPGTVLVMNTHYLNASAEELDADARINLFTMPPEEMEVEAGMMFHYNGFIRVPANGSASARMRCPVEQDISIVRVQSHMHRRGVGFAAHRVSGQDGGMEEIYTSADWENVPAEEFTPPLAIKAGDALDFRCDYVNTESRDVAQGLKTSDEMCMLIGPYYPKDPRIDQCVDEQGLPAETWIGSGAATCAAAMECFTTALFSGDGDPGVLYGCVVDSCEGAADEISSFVRCEMSAGYGACDAECDASVDGCAACISTACAAEVGACEAAACD